MSLQVTEEVVTIQGTGHLIGVVQYFVRLAGCSLKSCPIRHACDEARSFSHNAGTATTVAAVVSRAVDAVGVGGWLHVTGGEPTEAPGFEHLVRAANGAGLRVHIQTSGVRAIEAPFDWLTVSPKVPLGQLRQRYGSELAVVYQGQTDAELLELVDRLAFWYAYLVPLTVDGAPYNAAAAEEAVVRLNLQGSREHHNGRRWLLGIQAHRVWGCP